MLEQVEIVATIDHPRWGGGTLADDDEKSAYISSKCFVMLMIVMLVTSHHYLVQKNLSIIVIEKHMLARQQTQLSNFFEVSQDCVVVASTREGYSESDENRLEIELCNK